MIVSACNLHNTVFTLIFFLLYKIYDITTLNHPPLNVLSNIFFPFIDQKQKSLSHHRRTKKKKKVYNKGT